MLLADSSQPHAELSRFLSRDKRLVCRGTHVHVIIIIFLRVWNVRNREESTSRNQVNRETAASFVSEIEPFEKCPNQRSVGFDDRSRRRYRRPLALGFLPFARLSTGLILFADVTLRWRSVVDGSASNYDLVFSHH